MSELAIKTVGLSKTFGEVKAVSGVSLEVKKGEVFGFLGPNGAGKTTTIKMLLDMLHPSAGTATVLGLDSRKKSVKVHKDIGFLAGDMELFENLTGHQYLQFMAHLKGGVPAKQIAELVARLDANLRQKIGTLSRGNQQKIGLVSALMHDPELLILDEPTSGLDPLIQAQFNEIMHEHKARGKTVFISSHVLSEVQLLCDRVGFMRSGELVQTIDVKSLLSKNIKIVEITFSKPLNAIRPKLLPGMEIIEKTSHELRLHYKDGSPALIAWLSKLPVSDLSIQNSDLDDTFLQLYSKDEEAGDV